MMSELLIPYMDANIEDEDLFIDAFKYNNLPLTKFMLPNIDKGIVEQSLVTCPVCYNILLLLYQDLNIRELVECITINIKNISKLQHLTQAINKGCWIIPIDEAIRVVDFLLSKLCDMDNIKNILRDLFLLAVNSKQKALIKLFLSKVKFSNQFLYKMALKSLSFKDRDYVQLIINDGHLTDKELLQKLSTECKKVMPYVKLIKDEN